MHRVASDRRFAPRHDESGGRRAEHGQHHLARRARGFQRDDRRDRRDQRFGAGADETRAADRRLRRHAAEQIHLRRRRRTRSARRRDTAAIRASIDSPSSPATRRRAPNRSAITQTLQPRQAALVAGAIKRRVKSSTAPDCWMSSALPAAAPGGIDEQHAAARVARRERLRRRTAYVTGADDRDGLSCAACKVAPPVYCIRR